MIVIAKTQATGSARLAGCIAAALAAGLTPVGVTAVQGEEAASPSMDLRQYGARLDGHTDDTAAFKRALAAAPDGAALSIPAGTALLSEPLQVHNKALTLRGAGMFSTHLRWTRPGGFRLSDDRSWTETKGALASWEFSGLCLEAGVAAAGVALDLAPQSARLSPSVIIRDCRFEPAPGTAGTYWTTSIDIRGGHLGQVTGCYFRGAPAPEATTTHHLHLSGNSTTYMIENCHGSQSRYGVLVEGETEGVVIARCFFVKNAYGYVLNIAEGGEPMFDVHQSHAASCVHALWMRNGRSSSAIGNLFILRGDGYARFRDPDTTPALIRLEGPNTKDVVLSNNALQMNDPVLTGPFDGIQVVAGRGVLVGGNTIANNGQAVGEAGIRFGAGVRESLAADNLFHLSKTATEVAVSPETVAVRVR